MSHKNETKKERVNTIIKHYITKYEENDELYVESWIQINLFGYVWCFSRRRIKIPKQ